MRKKLLLAFGVIGATVFSTNSMASDFIHLPLNCVVRTDAPVEIQVSIARQGNRILGVIEENGDQANLVCRRVANQSFGHNLECHGRWASDGSKALFLATLDTYVPFGTVQLSQAGSNGETVNDLCINR